MYPALGPSADALGWLVGRAVATKCAGSTTSPSKCVECVVRSAAAAPVACETAEGVAAVAGFCAEHGVKVTDGAFSTQPAKDQTLCRSLASSLLKVRRALKAPPHAVQTFPTPASGDCADLFESKCKADLKDPAACAKASHPPAGRETGAFLGLLQNILVTEVDTCHAGLLRRTMLAQCVAGATGGASKLKCLTAAVRAEQLRAVDNGWAQLSPGLTCSELSAGARARRG